MSTLLILSTIPHFLAMLPLIDQYSGDKFQYVNVVAISTVFSILWHAKQDSILLFYLDHFSAMTWLLYDMLYAVKGGLVIPVLLCNFIIFAMNLNIKDDKHYRINHSMWHILSAAKCLYVAYLIKSIKL